MARGTKQSFNFDETFHTLGGNPAGSTDGPVFVAGNQNCMEGGFASARTNAGSPYGLLRFNLAQ